MNAQALKKLSDDEIVLIARNALVAAGLEIGLEGDHWPVIKDTVGQIMRDWEELKIERNVQNEMKKHLYAQLDIIERDIPFSNKDIQETLREKVAGLREVYDAFFSPVEEDVAIVLEDEEVPVHIKRARAILEATEVQDA